MTGFNGVQAVVRERLLKSIDDDILALWSAGRDTLDIAREMGVPESIIYNRLPKLIHRHDARNGEAVA